MSETCHQLKAVWQTCSPGGQPLYRNPVKLPTSNIVQVKNQEINDSLRISLLTGGSDRPYVFGLVTSLVEQSVHVDLIGSDELDIPAFQNNPQIRFLNLRGGANTDASLTQKVFRILRYYTRLIAYASRTRNRLFHILWNNKFELFDRTFLMLLYRLLGKKVVLTVHNVNTEKRDGYDSALNRLTLAIQYRLCANLFTHTESMKQELIADYGVDGSRITLIPFGINNAVPITSLTETEARKRLGLEPENKAILFFGRITPYKGLDLLVSAFRSLHTIDSEYRLIIAGREDACDAYWQSLRRDIAGDIEEGSIILHNRFIADEDTEIYFKAADVSILPYRDVYQSGVLFLSLSFGLPVIASDVGSFCDVIHEGENGALFMPNSISDLQNKLESYFNSALYRSLSSHRDVIRARTVKSHSWVTVSEHSLRIYKSLLPSHLGSQPNDASLTKITSEGTRS